jgi:fibro-slime domain-containing protein
MWMRGLICTLYLFWFAVFQFRTTLADAHPPLTISMILRDFKSYNEYMGHPDFNNAQGSEKGITHQYLSQDKKPVYNVSKISTSTTHGVTWFDKWFRDSEYCIEIRDHIVLNWDSMKRKYVYYNDSFFPLDNRGWGNEGRDSKGKIRNFGFTAEFNTFFTYQGDETFTFSGDDDVWVYINNYRIIDLGGVHFAETQSVSLSKFEAAASLKKGSRYDFNFFFAERHEQYSVFRIETSVDLQDCPKADACGVCNGNATVNKCVGIDCGNGTCDCNTGFCKCANGWSQVEKNGPCTSFCGNGIIEPGEECDLGTSINNNKDKMCCDKFCHFVDAGVPCEQTTNLCKSSTCDGAGHCSSAVLYNSTCVPKNPSKCILEMCNQNGTCGITLPKGSVCDVATKPCTQKVCDVNGACSEVQMADGTTCEGSYEVGSCVGWSCSKGQCEPTPKKQGLTCPSNDLCTTGSCDAVGNCIISQNITRCQSTNPCSQPIGRCDSRTGACIFENLMDGAPCSIPNRKDCASFSCQKGTCEPTSLCPGTSCGRNPVCNLTTGNCDFPPGACCGNGRIDSGEYCDDAGAGCCKFCNVWSEEGTPCNDLNPCSNSRCNYKGECIVNPLPVGSPCGESGNPCTRMECQGGGVCKEVPQPGIQCGPSDECTSSICSSGFCTKVAKADNTPCDVNNTADPCSSHVCKKGICNKLHAADGKACGSDACGSLECSVGVCVAGPTYKQCSM